LILQGNNNKSLKHSDIEASQLTFIVYKTYKQKYQNNDHFENIAITAKINVTFHSRMKGKCGVLCNTSTF
jgi:hypothetical protein